MINNSNNKSQSQELQGLLNGLLGKTHQTSDDIIKLLGALSEEDIKKISVLMSNPEMQKIASSIIQSQKRKE